MSNCGLGPRGTSMTTEVRTNIFTSSEPLHRALATLLHTDTPPPCPPPPCKYTVWYHWHRLWIFSSLKICYVGAWKCQGRHAGSEIYWEFIDHQKLLSKEKKAREGPRSRLIRMQPLFPISPPSKNLYQAKFAYTCICTDPIKRQGADTIPGFKAEYLPVFQL